jgi:hypothetical protein
MMHININHNLISKFRHQSQSCYASFRVDSLSILCCSVNISNKLVISRRCSTITSPEDTYRGYIEDANTILDKVTTQALPKVVKAWHDYIKAMEQIKAVLQHDPHYSVEINRLYDEIVTNFEHRLRYEYRSDPFIKRLHILTERNPHMKFLENPVLFLDRLIETCIIAPKPFNNVVNSNSIELGQNSYKLSCKGWEKIFNTLINDAFNGEGSPNRDKVTRFIKSAYQNTIESIISDPEYLSKYCAVNQELISKGDTKINHKDLVVDKVHFEFIQTLLKYLNQYRVFASFASKRFDGDDPNAIPSIELTKDFLYREFSINLNTLYTTHKIHFNSIPESADDNYGIRLPYATTCSSLGNLMSHLIWLVHQDGKKYIIDPDRNPYLKVWLSDPNIANPTALLSPDLELGFLTGLNMNAKQTKFVITFICVSYYESFYENLNCFKDFPETSAYLQSIFGGYSERSSTGKRKVTAEKKLDLPRKIHEIKSYLVGFNIKLGVTLFNLCVSNNIFTGSRTISMDEIMVKEQYDKSVKVKNNKRIIKTIVIAEINPLLKNFFIPLENLSRPYLIDENIDIDKISKEYLINKDSTWSMYRARLQTKVIHNKFTSCKILDERILNHSSNMTIDQDALLSLLMLIDENSKITKENYLDTYPRAYLSLLNTDPFHIQLFLTESEKSCLSKGDHLILNDIFDYFTNFNASNSISFTIIKRLNKSHIGNKNQWIELINRVAGYKLSLIYLITDAIVYSLFSNIILPSILDTRTRRYYRNTTLNIQAYQLVKSIVKPTNLALTKTSNTEELIGIVGVFKELVNELVKILGPKFKPIGDAWLKKHEYDNPSAHTFDRMVKKSLALRKEQLATYFQTVNQVTPGHFVDQLLTQDSSKAFSNEKNYLEQFLLHLKEPKKLLLALNLYKGIASAQVSKFKSRPFPYELDAVASGIQMTALFLKSPQLAEWSNLTPSTKKQDLYTTAGVMFKQAVETILNYEIKFNIYNDVCSVVPLPAKFRWFTETLDVFSFHLTRVKLIEILKNHYPVFEESCRRKIWKNSIMTYTYSSTTGGRTDHNTAFLKEKTGTNNNVSQFMGKLVEKFFTKVAQPELTSDTSKMIQIAKLLTNNLKTTNNGNRLATSISIRNTFAIHYIHPPKVFAYRYATNSFKKHLRGYQLKLNAVLHDSDGYPLYDIHKAKQLVSPNTMHQMDAAIVHQRTINEGILNKLLEKTDIKYRFVFTSTHDSFGCADSYFHKSLIELAYLQVYFNDPLTGMADNPNFDKVQELVYTKPDNEDNNLLLTLTTINDEFMK